ncbi:MAG TPA: hypothetical protein VFM57_00470 [Thermoleophilaceae bacterium]|nr:hypothetical protein [Thermoleophilaceae bacterium]
MATSGVQPPDPEQHAQDALLPDPSSASMGWAAAFLAAAVVTALLADVTNLREVLKSLQKAKGSGTTPG